MNDAARIMEEAKNCPDFKLAIKPQDKSYLFSRQGDGIVDNRKLKDLGWEPQIDYVHGFGNMVKIHNQCL